MFLILRIIYFQGDSYVSLADYNAIRPTDATLKRGDKVDLLKAGSSSWWYVKIHGKCSVITTNMFFFVIIFIEVNIFF